MEWLLGETVMLAFQGDKYGCLAVHRKMQGDGATISHIGTGYSLAKILPGMLDWKLAQEIAERLVDDVPDIDEKLKTVFDMAPEQDRLAIGRELRAVVEDVVGADAI